MEEQALDHVADARERVVDIGDLDLRRNLKIRAFLGLALAPVFPLLPWFWPLLLLQMVNGGALQFAWSGSQTLIAQLAERPSISGGSVFLRASARPQRR